MLSPEQLSFIEMMRVGRLATVDTARQPHAIPVCYACDGSSFYIALDDKPKHVAPERLKRVQNILKNPQVALLIDRYSDDWTTLAYLLIRGTAALVAPGTPEQSVAIAMLRRRYAQYAAMPIQERPVIMIRPISVIGWGSLLPA